MGRCGSADACARVRAARVSGGARGAGKQLLGLCAGNYCASGGDGQQRGNGRLVEAALREGPNGTCAWVPQHVIRLPSAAYFAEFSSLAFRGNRTLISSRARRRSNTFLA